MYSIHEGLTYNNQCSSSKQNNHVTQLKIHLEHLRNYLPCLFKLSSQKSLFTHFNEINMDII